MLHCMIAIRVPPDAVYLKRPVLVAASLADLEEVLGADRPILIAREMTKLHEEFLRGTLSTVRRALPTEIKGEFTVVIGPPPSGIADSSPESIAPTPAPCSRLPTDHPTTREEGASP